MWILPSGFHTTGIISVLREQRYIGKIGCSYTVTLAVPTTTRFNFHTFNHRRSEFCDKNVEFRANKRDRGLLPIPFVINGSKPINDSWFAWCRVALELYG